MIKKIMLIKVRYWYWLLPILILIAQAIYTFSSFNQIRISQIMNRNYFFLLLILEKIYRNIPDKSFLGEEKIRSFLERVIKGGIAKESKCAKELARKYFPGNERLSITISKLESVKKDYSSKKKQIEGEYKTNLKEI